MPLSILVIDRFPPWSPVQGNSLIGREVFRRLTHHRLTLVAPADDSERGAEHELRGVFEEIHLVRRPRRIAALTGSIEPHVARLPILSNVSAGSLDVASARALREQVRQLAAARAFDVIHVRQLPMAGYARWIEGPKLLELIDSETLGVERARPRSVRTRIRGIAAAVAERVAMRGYDVVTAVADADAERLRLLVPGQRVEVVPNGVDAERFRPDPSVAAVPGRIVFVGAMSYGPNVAAMRFFTDSVLPRIQQQRPDAQLVIVGRDPSLEVRNMAQREGVVVTGEVDDVLEHLLEAAVFVAPMISGSGIKNKVLEALAAGRPVVATELAVEGLRVSHGRDLVVADAQGFASAVVDLLNDRVRAEALGRAGRARVEAAYTWGSCAAAYDRLYEELASRRGSRARAQ